VAVVVEYLERLKQDAGIPTVTEKEERLFSRHGYAENIPADSDAAAADIEEPLPSYLNRQNRRQLVTMVESLARRYPEVHEFVNAHARLSTGDTGILVRSIKRKIAALSSEPAWRHHWDNEGYIPDYSEVGYQLEDLLSSGFADEVVELGKILFDAGTHQVEESDDEGETADQIASCMQVVFKALSQSSLSPSEQMLWAIDYELSDDYYLCAGSRVFWDKKHKVADWNAVADRLQERLRTSKRPEGDADSWRYRRDRLTDFTILALDSAKRSEEVIPLCEREAIVTGSYVRLVRRLVQDGRTDDAEGWIRKGIGSLKGRWPGIGAQLRDSLYEIRKKARDWPTVAALDADTFFMRPDFASYDKLRQSSERAKAWPEVKAAVTRYLETGDLPGDKQRRGDKEVSRWPLPETGLREKRIERQDDFPVFETLIDIAISEQRTDDVLRWYDQSRDRDRRWWGIREDKVALAVSAVYPDRAIAIWKSLAESLIKLTQPNAYEQAAVYLAEVRRTLNDTARRSEWQSYVATLRTANTRKRRFMEVLARLDDKPIIETWQGAEEGANK